jgi:large subunit ribosomal protein L10
MLKSKKEEVLNDLKGIVEKSESIVFLNFHGLKVNDEAKLRRDLRSKNVNYRVSRKTLLKKALAGKFAGELPELPGEVAIAYSAPENGPSGDDTAPAREVYGFQKAHKGLLKILGGVLENKFMDGAKMLEIAMIPSRDVLYAKILGLINSPRQRLVFVLDQIAKSKS